MATAGLHSDARETVTYSQLDAGAALINADDGGIEMLVINGSVTENGNGTFIVSGATASLRGGANFLAFASAKFALRGFTQSLAREHQPAGIHVCHVILDGIIDTGGPANYTVSTRQRC